MTTEILLESPTTASEAVSPLRADQATGMNPAARLSTSASHAAGPPRLRTSVGVPVSVARRMQRYSELTGLPFLCIDCATSTVLGATDSELLPMIPAEICARMRSIDGAALVELPSGLMFYSLPLPDIDRCKTAAIGYAIATPDVRPQDLVLAAAEANWPKARLDRWLARIPCGPPGMLRLLLDAAVKHLALEERNEVLEAEIEDLGEQIEHTYEEISLLHSLTRNLQISRNPLDLAELCVSRMHGLIRSEGNIIWAEEKSGRQGFLVMGEIPFDETGMARLIARFETHDWSRPLVKNRVEGTLLGADFPGLRNFVVVPIAEGNYRSGWILSCNLSDGREYGTVEASLINSVATILGTHLRNIDLYQQHNDLLICFVRSLVSTLDAKDPYTRGHSERVALIARRIGEEFGLPEDDLHDIYLSGLLHDIGKIGVDDRILQKPGKLTDEEFHKIQEHPMMGYTILSGLKNLQKVLPGVRNHHESYNGKGYPDRLKGDEIPLMARILAVADSYDAMGGDRPYRKGMPLEQVEQIFRRGAGEQWDARVIDAYFAARDDIGHLCENYSPADGNLLMRMSRRHEE